MKNGKFNSELLAEYFAHWFLRIVFILGAGGVFTGGAVVLGGGFFFVDYLGAPTGSLSDAEATLGYGLLSLAGFLTVSKGWWIRELLEEWNRLGAMHSHAVNRMKRF